MKSLEKKIKKLRGSHSQLLYWLFVLGIQKNSSKNYSPLRTCGLTKYRPHKAVSLLQFSENFKIAISQNLKESLTEMENMKEKLSCDLWFCLLDVKVTITQLLETVLKNSCPQKCMSLKKHLFPNFTVAFVDILRNRGKLVYSVW